MRSIIWLDDNPHYILEDELEVITQKFELQLWDGELTKGEQRGDICLSFFKDSLTKFVKEPNQLAGIILDAMILVNNLSILGMPQVKTHITGLAILNSYLRNNCGDSPVNNIFKNTPVLIYSCIPVYKNDDWFVCSENKWICKMGSDSVKELEAWIKQLI